ncbi:laccase-7 isoform X2 [Lotus japonicus]|uniref:laccase-7 isoform X2 n=1 Tax=Lotus japonicus TaxID=34305 RepID=UPI00258B86ED|nr:laccase-7 isoform X2 [Lotus japonicus]
MGISTESLLYVRAKSIPWSMLVHVQNRTIKRLCNERVIVTVNGLFPGPTINVHEGDTVIVHVFNEAPYNITIHWHGVFQLFSGWADGPEYVTQCPISSGNNYTYKFKVQNQEGTLWWHAHASVLRATVHGAFIIHPRSGQFPFPKPYKQIPIILGDWYNAGVEDMEKALAAGGRPELSSSFTINGLPGDIFSCSQKGQNSETFKMKVKQGKTYMLRMVNAVLELHLFVTLANHNFTVVAVDATYTDPYVTDVIVIAPGQTLDALFTANQPIGSYYMVASPYKSGGKMFDNITSRGIVVYDHQYAQYSSSHLVMPSLPSLNPMMPFLPPFNDTPTAHKFYSNITSLVGAPHWVPVPLEVDEHMFITVGLNLQRCDPATVTNDTCKGPMNHTLSPSMNNESFVLPKGRGYSMLEAFFENMSGVYTTDFPSKPPVMFDFTNPDIRFDLNLIFAPKSTKVKKLKFNSTVEIVFQNTAFIHTDNHAMHLHGFNFHVLAQGFGNFDPTSDEAKFNLVNPQIRNTIGVPVGGWAVIRFQANNPGVWFVHCHVEHHTHRGFNMAFEVENGPTLSTSLTPPPADLPKC